MERSSEIHNRALEGAVVAFERFDRRVLKRDARRRIFVGIVGLFVGMMAWVVMVAIASVTCAYFATVAIYNTFMKGAQRREDDMRFILLLDVTVTASLLVPICVFFLANGFHFIINVVSSVLTSYSMVLLADKGYLWYTPGQVSSVI